ncbi:MAG TPA: WGR domain-containing protein [Agrobacterium sp.]|uniref:WGR domain-containing protein n=1 Tax=Rhizobium sp. TaxID=391 RepID=UPI000E9AF61A|nr:WGR domain-containing protein [Agrobacterium sp.]
MIYQPYNVLVHRRDPTRRMARYYGLSVEPSLLGGIILVRRWGRAGRTERRCVEHFCNEQEAVIAFLTLLARKRRRGYRPEPVAAFHT